MKIYINLFESSSQELHKGARVQCDKISGLRASRHQTNYVHVSCMIRMINKNSVRHKFRTPFKTRLERMCISSLVWKRMDLEEPRNLSAILMQITMQIESSDWKIFEHMWCPYDWTINCNFIEHFHTHFLTLK